MEGASTLGDFFEIFRVRPHLGRLDSAQNATSGEQNVVALRYE